MILFDNDGTLNTAFSCWRYVQIPLGIFEPNGKELLETHLAGGMNYEEFSKKSVALWRGIKIADIEHVVNDIPLRDGALEVLSYFRKHGYRVSCVSSGFDIWRKIFKEKYGFEFDDFLANHLVVDSNGYLTGEIEVNVTDDTPLKNKGEHLKKLCRKYDIDYESSIMVGDGIGDINGFNFAGISFAVEPTHSQVAMAANHVIQEESLIKILDYFEDGVYRL